MVKRRRYCRNFAANERMRPLLHWIVIPAAVFLDQVLGDPHRLPHPVRWMGMAIEKLEPPLRRPELPPVLCGGVFWLLLVAGAYIAAAAGVAAAGAIHVDFRIVLEIILIYYCLSARALCREAMGVYRALKNDDLAVARNRVAMIVGRETRNLTATEVARAAVETVAENLVDGVVAPLFFAALGGAPLAVAYKMVNTLDSMVGYKNDRYRLFGRVSARMDDLFNYLPARLCVPVIALCAELYLKNSLKRTFVLAVRDGRNHTSPNAGFPEAAFAGALKARLGGPGVYHGKVVHKPFIGAEFDSVKTDHIQTACRLMQLSALIWALCMWPVSQLL